MIKKTLTYEDFDGNEVTEDHYFHLSKSDLLEMEMKYEGGILGQLKRIMSAENNLEMLGIFKDIIAASYGQRDGQDAKTFFKSETLSKRFIQSLAFDALFMDLMSNTGSTSAFITGLVPKDLVDTKAVDSIMSQTPEEMRANVLNQPASPTVTEKAALPDPNYLDTGEGAWPRGQATADESSGLRVPHDGEGKLVPWAFREPTEKELIGMTHPQMQDVYRRRASDWTPTPPQV